MKNYEKNFIEYMKNAGTAQGMQDDLLLEIFAQLYLEPEEIAMDELAEKTGYSLASISNKVKQMESMGFSAMGLLKRVKKPGSKKIYLHMEKDFMDLWKKMLTAKHEAVVKKAKEEMPKIIENAKKEKADKEKLEVIKNYYSQILKFENVLNIMLKGFEKYE